MSITTVHLDFSVFPNRNSVPMKHDLPPLPFQTWISLYLLMLYWGYIVTFTKVLTTYHRWIHPSIILLRPGFHYSTFCFYGFDSVDTSCKWKFQCSSLCVWLISVGIMSSVDLLSSRMIHVAYVSIPSFFSDWIMSHCTHLHSTCTHSHFTRPPKGHCGYDQNVR
jgi:hypothetical protein